MQLTQLEPDARVRWILFLNAHSASLDCGADWTPRECWKRAGEGRDWLLRQGLHPNIWDAALDRDWFDTPAGRLSDLWISRPIDWIGGLAALEGNGGSSWSGGTPTAHELHSNVARNADPEALEVYRRRYVLGETYEQIAATLGRRPDEVQLLFDQVVSLAARIYHSDCATTPCFENAISTAAQAPSPPPSELLDLLCGRFEHDIRSRIDGGESASEVAKDLRLPFASGGDKDSLIESLKRIFAQ